MIHATGTPPVTVLASGVTLGVYLPALLIREQLRKRGVDVRVEVLENLYSPSVKQRLLENKSAFHARFAVALMGQKLSANVSASIDRELAEDTFASWQEEGRRLFIVFSGFWMPLIREYIQRCPELAVRIDKCHMDAAMSVSWGAHEAQEASPPSNERDVWFFTSERQMEYEVSVIDEPPISYELRDDRVVVHGGGWGIGTYQERMRLIPHERFSVDLVVHDGAEEQGNARNLMIRPGWDPWVRDANGEYVFPPMGILKDGSYQEFEAPGTRHQLFELIRSAKAIISKPGGMTLVDSLASATPLIHLEPFGRYESENAALWERLGFAISFTDWIEGGASTDTLEAMHRALLAVRTTLRNYGEEYGV